MEDLTKDELETERGAMLPEREAMSILPIDAGAYAGVAEAADAYGPTPDATAADPATAAATDATDAASTDAEASGSGEESTTSEPRSEHVSQSDTAVSQT